MWKHDAENSSGGYFFPEVFEWVEKKGFLYKLPKRKGFTQIQKIFQKKR